MYFCVNRICVIPNNCYLQVRAYPPIRFAEWNGDKDRSEYDVSVHMSDLQHGVCARMWRACGVQIKPGMLHAACFIDVRVWTRIRFAVQNGDFRIAEKRLFNTVYARAHITTCVMCVLCHTPSLLEDKCVITHALSRPDYLI